MIISAEDKRVSLVLEKIRELQEKIKDVGLKAILLVPETLSKGRGSLEPNTRNTNFSKLLIIPYTVLRE